MLIMGLVSTALAGAALAQAPPGPPTAIDSRTIGDNSRTRLVVDLDRPVEATSFLLADPVRVVVDLPEIAFRLAPTAGREGRGLVSAYRYGLLAQGRSRIVVDARVPVLVERLIVLPPGDGQPARLIVDLVPASGEDFARAVERDARQAAARSEARPAPPSPPTPRAQGARPAPDPRAELPLVVLDPGHGGVDAGATTADGHFEKTIVLDFTRALRDRLQASGRVRVMMTRETDVFVPLDERMRFARDRQAALFLSVHADSLARPFLGTAVSGASVYTLSERASDQEAAAYAERENRADLIAGIEVPPEADEVTGILFDLMHRETKNFSVRFARALVEELRPHMRLVRNPHRFAGFRVLRAPNVPSALLELGYLSSREDVRLLTDPEWRRRTADAIARATLAFVQSSHARAPLAAEARGVAETAPTPPRR